MPKKELVGKSIHKDLEDVINDREAVIARRGDTKYVNITSDDTDYAGQVIQTIICEGDAIGAVIVLSKDDKMRFGKLNRKPRSLLLIFSENRWRTNSMSFALRNGEKSRFSRQNGVLTLTNTGILGINIHVGA